MCRPLLIPESSSGKLQVVKSIFLALTLALLSTPLFAEDWTTSDGTVYQNVKVVRVEDDAITVIYKDGGALIPLVKLPESLRKQYGYDPVKAKAAAEARSKADADNAKQLQAEMELSNKMKKQQQIKDSGPTNAPPR